MQARTRARPGVAEGRERHESTGAGRRPGRANGEVATADPSRGVARNCGSADDGSWLQCCVLRKRVCGACEHRCTRRVRVRLCVAGAGAGQCSQPVPVPARCGAGGVAALLFGQRWCWVREPGSGRAPPADTGVVIAFPSLAPARCFTARSAPAARHFSHPPRPIPHPPLCIQRPATAAAPIRHIHETSQHVRRQAPCRRPAAHQAHCLLVKPPAPHPMP